MSELKLQPLDDMPANLKDTVPARNASCYNRVGAVGTWRSLVARTLGVREVAGSNPVVPTILSPALKPKFFGQRFTRDGNLCRIF